MEKYIVSCIYIIFNCYMLNMIEILILSWYNDILPVISSHLHAYYDINN